VAVIEAVAGRSWKAVELLGSLRLCVSHFSLRLFFSEIVLGQNRSWLKRILVSAPQILASPSMHPFTLSLAMSKQNHFVCDLGNQENSFIALWG
jgi:hypothetical protein